MVETIRAPKWILFILWPFKGESSYPQIVGDLSEEYHLRVESNGISAASRWYYREVFRNLRSMILRRIMIPVIIVPLLCLFFSLVFREVPRELSTSFHNWLISSPKFFFGLSSLSWSEILLGYLLSWSIIGLFLGIISSQILKGHERMVRVIFGVYQLGIFVLIYHYYGRWDFFFSDNAPIEYKILGNGAFYLKPLWTFIFIWIGSIWIERHPIRHRVA